MLTRVNRALAVAGMAVAIVGLWTITLLVAWQVFGRYVMNDTPTWAESLTLVLVLYVALIGAAVGVRDAGHIGMESLLVLVSEPVRVKLEIVIYALVGVFGAMMLWYGGGLTAGVLSYKIPTLGISEGFHYAPLMVSGALIALFSVEHVIALGRGEVVEPAWH
ncbi:MAG: TRAP transporter small permease [Burkholderiales bacterium]|nr:TRAP transporter small permease [Burkholderiales bacterium]MCC7114982.1 TRAP transporter small permease [Burkholderiales bacterium]